jgi:hypothetical protein
MMYTKLRTIVVVNSDTTRLYSSTRKKSSTRYIRSCSAHADVSTLQVDVYHQ